MALTTRCPVCGTLFKVVPDQLRISEGWVRCGHCADIFDASGGLQQSDVEQHSVQPAASSPEVVEEPSVLASAPAWMPEPVQDVPEPIGLGSEPILLPEPEPEPEGMEWVPEALVAPLIDGAPDSPPVLASEPILAADAASYSFTRELPVQSMAPRYFWQGMWAAAAMLLVAALGLQGMVYGRDSMAATWPETKPLLQVMCARMGCSVHALRQIEAIVIDSSTLSALQNEDAYRLNMVLRNQARVDLAMPAIEFVLTDVDEQVVFRRVLTPAELGAASRVLFAGREWVASVDLRVIENPSKESIVGYRLLAFYP